MLHLQMVIVLLRASKPVPWLCSRYKGIWTALNFDLGLYDGLATLWVFHNGYDLKQNRKVSECSVWCYFLGMVWVLKERE